MPSSLVWYKCVSRLIVSNSLWSQGLWPMRFLCPWNFPGKNTGVGCYFLLQRILPDPGIEPGSPALQADSLPSEPLGKIVKIYKRINVQHAHQTYFCCLVDQSLLQPRGLLPTRFLCACDFPGKNTGVVAISFLQGIFVTQELNPHVLYCRRFLTAEPPGNLSVCI